MIVTKAIKPGRFRSEAFARAIGAAAKQAADEIQKDFEATTATWKHKVKFDKIVSLEPSPVEVLVGTDDEIYRYVDEGTKAHPIFAKRAPALVFAWGGPGSYTPKTKPRVIGSTPGGSSGPTVFRAYVDHPGTEARQFDKTIRQKWEPKFKRLMEGALKTARQQCGHSYS